MLDLAALEHRPEPAEVSFLRWIADDQSRSVSARLEHVEDAVVGRQCSIEADIFALWKCELIEDSETVGSLGDVVEAKSDELLGEQLQKIVDCDINLLRGAREY